MQSILNFIKYNNAVPIVLAIFILGTGVAFAASPKLRDTVFSESVSETQPFVVPKSADTANLLKEDIDTYAISVRIDRLVENSDTYVVEYSYNTYDIVNGIWQETRKSQRMDVPKAMLGKRSLTDYLSEQIGQKVHQEIAYLGEVQRIASGENVEKSRVSKYAGLVGKKLAVGDGMPSSVSTGAQQTTTVSDEDDNEDVSSLASAGISEEKLRDLIVQAVAEFLAVDISMPELPTIAEPVIIEPVPIVKPEMTTYSDASDVSEVLIEEVTPDSPTESE